MRAPPGPVSREQPGLRSEAAAQASPARVREEPGGLGQRPWLPLSCAMRLSEKGTMAVIARDFFFF